MINTPVLKKRHTRMTQDVAGMVGTLLPDFIPWRNLPCLSCSSKVDIKKYVFLRHCLGTHTIKRLGNKVGKTIAWKVLGSTQILFHSFCEPGAIRMPLSHITFMLTSFLQILAWPYPSLSPDSYFESAGITGSHKNGHP